MGPVLEIPCRPCDRWFLAVPNVRWVCGEVEARHAGMVRGEFICPDCRRSWAMWVNRLWEPLLRAAVTRWPDVEFEVDLFAAELAAAGDRAATLITGGTA